MYSKSELKQLIPMLLPYIGLIALFVLGNYIFVQVQDLWHKGDREKLEVMQSELEDTRRYLENEKSRIGVEVYELEQENKRLKDLRNSPSVIDNEIEINRYNHDVDTYNAKSNRLKQESDKLNARIDKYNTDLKEAKKLAEDVGSTWYLIPMARGAH